LTGVINFKSSSFGPRSTVYSEFLSGRRMSTPTWRNSDFGTMGEPVAVTRTAGPDSDLGTTDSERRVYAGGSPLEVLHVVTTGLGDAGVEEEVVVMGVEILVEMNRMSGVSRVPELGTLVIIPEYCTCRLTRVSFHG